MADFASRFLNSLIDVSRRAAGLAATSAQAHLAIWPAGGLLKFRIDKHGSEALGLLRSSDCVCGPAPRAFTLVDLGALCARLDYRRESTLNFFRGSLRKFRKPLRHNDFRPEKSFGGHPRVGARCQIHPTDTALPAWFPGPYRAGSISRTQRNRAFTTSRHNAHEATCPLCGREYVMPIEAASSVRAAAADYREANRQYAHEIAVENAIWRRDQRVEEARASAAARPTPA
jgi:hypothetical protein